MTLDKTTRIELRHRGHRIIADVRKGRPTAAIWLGDVAATKDRFTGETIEQAVDAAKSWIDSKQEVAKAGRRGPHIGTVQEYVDAFTARPPKEFELKMLRAHAAANVLTATQLAAAAGYDDYGPANMLYGKFAREIAEQIGLQPVTPNNERLPIWTTALATGLDEGDQTSGHFRWRIHDEVKIALSRLGLHQER